DGSLLDQLARLLRPGGQLFVQTDVEERAEAFLTEIKRHGAFEVVGGSYVADNPFGAVSNREARAIEDGLPIYRILAERPSARNDRLRSARRCAKLAAGIAVGCGGKSGGYSRGSAVG